MVHRLVLIFVGLGALSGIVRADPDSPEFQRCTPAGEDTHRVIECLSTARDEWDRKASNVMADLVEKIDDVERRRFYTRAKKQREQRVARCGVPSPVTVAAAECQRAMAQEQLVELERAAALFEK